MSEYTTAIEKIADLNDETRQRIVALYLNYYDGSSEMRVLSDLRSKTEILLLFHNGSPAGFTTLQVYPYEWRDKPVRIIYSGDTVVDRAHWGQQALAFAWIYHMGEIKSEAADLPLYWFVIVKGHRTFKYLPTFNKSFYPHWSIDRSDLKPLADSLAFDKFGKFYDSHTGIVEFPESQGHLKEEIAYPTKEELNKESVRYFLKKNPGYRRGNELVCLCEMEESNMKPLTKRIFKKACNGK